MNALGIIATTLAVLLFLWVLATLAVKKYVDRMSTQGKEKFVVNNKLTPVPVGWNSETYDALAYSLGYYL